VELKLHAVDYTPMPGAGRHGMKPNSRRRIGRDTLTHKVLSAWFNMSKSTRRLILANPGEAYLLFLLILSDLAFFLSWTLKAVIVPNEAGISLISVEIGLLLLVSLVGRTAAMYFFAMLAGSVCRLFGGFGSWRATRIAVFWAAFVTAPFSVAAALFSVLFTNLEMYYPIFGAAWISMPPYWFGLLPFVWYLSVAITQAHGFRRVSPIFMGLSLVSLVALMGGMYFRARGMI